MKKILFISFVLSLLVLVGCSSEPKQSRSEYLAELNIPEDAYNLAILNSGNLALPMDDPSVDKFDKLLESISSRVSQDRVYVGEASAGASKYVGDSTLLIILEAVDKKLPSDATDEDFNQYIGFQLATLGDLPDE